MSDIDWSKAPEDATHFNPKCSYPWLRDGGCVRYFADERGWRDYGTPAGGRRAINEAVPRPVATGPLRAEEFDHLVEPDWSEAPEGATHWGPATVTFPEWWYLFGGEPGEMMWHYWRDGLGWTPVSAGMPERIPQLIARPTPQPEAHGGPTHPDNLAVHGFANAMRLRLSACRAAGKSGWDDPEQCPPQRLAEGLVRSLRAGKLVDVGNYAMMLWRRLGGTGSPAVPALIGEALERREPVEWDGTGMPPVGAVCEWRGHAGVWVSANIAAHVTKRSGTSFVLFELPDDYWHWESDPKRLRPLLTPEQRAAKERDEAVAAMLAVPEVFYDMQTMQALYDAGWRKTEGE